MPSAIAPNPRALPPDDLDALFNFDAGIEDGSEPQEDAGTTIARPGQQSAAQTTTANIDEDVVVTKKRTPVAKLDEERILSSTGIPRLRKITKKMRYKGKGHEFSDMNRLLNMYQLWLDEMYPRAKFADGLTMVEKLGHKKRIQLYRKEWIDEVKPKAAVDDTQDDASMPNSEDPTRAPHSGSHLTDAVEPSADKDPTAEVREGEAPSYEEGPPEDELDALLAEQHAIQPPTESRNDGNDVFADEEEILAQMMG